jgi:hypothetical protein
LGVNHAKEISVPVTPSRRLRFGQTVELNFMLLPLSLSFVSSIRIKVLVSLALLALLVLLVSLIQLMSLVSLLLALLALFASLVSAILLMSSVVNVVTVVDGKTIVEFVSAADVASVVVFGVHRIAGFVCASFVD